MVFYHKLHGTLSRGFIAFVSNWYRLAGRKPLPDRILGLVGDERGDLEVSMMSEQGEQWLDDHFPIVESYADFSGKQREFVIEWQPHPRGYFLRATEKRQSQEDDGYQFAAYSPTDPFYALGVLRDKIRRGLATRYLTSEQDNRQLSHDRLKGRIGYGGIVVDGEFISFDELGYLMQTYEGFQFSLVIVDLYDEA